MTAGDWIGLNVVLVATAAFEAYRYFGIEPRSWGSVCTAANPPFNCAVRAAEGWLQHLYLFGALALVVGLPAFFLRVPKAVQVGGVVAGSLAVCNYNATWGMVGIALAGWGWLRPAGE